MRPSIRWLALGGLAGPFLFEIVVVVEEFLQRGFLLSVGFDPLKSSFPSVNTLGPVGWMQTINFILVGLLIIGFAFALHFGISGGHGSIAGPVCIGLSGAALIVAGLFQTDLPVEAKPHTFHGGMHALAFVVSSLVTLVGYILLALRFRADPYWKGYGLFTVMIAVASIIAFVAPNLVHNVVVAYAGYVIQAVWFVVVGLKLWFSLSRSNHRAEAHRTA